MGANMARRFEGSAVFMSRRFTIQIEPPQQLHLLLPSLVAPRAQDLSEVTAASDVIFTGGD
mgnify:CR=1 FL=1